MSGAHRATQRRRPVLTAISVTFLSGAAAAAFMTMRTDDPSVPVASGAPPERSYGNAAPVDIAEPRVRGMQQASPDEPATTTPLPRRGTPRQDRRQLPEAGLGTFVIEPGRTPITGTGALVTYTVEVEAEVPLRRPRVAQVVDRVLSDPRGWTASGAHALARVEDDSTIRVLLATPATTDALCAPLETGGRLSCRNGELVVLNAWRWLNGADAYEGNLNDYRRYLVNHEVGHALGNAHVGCPGSGLPAPVMMQQTKGLGECSANPWPVT